MQSPRYRKVGDYQKGLKQLSIKKKKQIGILLNSETNSNVPNNIHHSKESKSTVGLSKFILMQAVSRNTLWKFLVDEPDKLM